MLEHSSKLYEKILDEHFREVVDIDKILHGFIPGRGTVDAVETYRKIQSQKEVGFFVFIDLENTFEWVPRYWF